MADRILLIEDTQDLARAICRQLEAAGYRAVLAGDGLTGVEMHARHRPDLVILDWMLPRLDGLQVLQRIRQSSPTPVLMLTARSEEADRVIGLEVGADDYLTKPFSMRELLARVKAQLRRVRLLRDQYARTEVSQPGNLLVFGGLTLDLDRHEVVLNGEIVTLKPKEYELLVYLAQKRGRVLSRDQILADVWGWDYVGGSRTVDVHIRWLREKIEDNPADPSRLITVRGAGYRFEG